MLLLLLLLLGCGYGVCGVWGCGCKAQRPARASGGSRGEPPPQLLPLLPPYSDTARLRPMARVISE